MKLKQWNSTCMWFLRLCAYTTAKSLQSCPTLCDPIAGSPPGSPVPGILQARTLEWVAISFSSAWKWKVKVKSLSRVWLLATPWTAAHQAPPPFCRPLLFLHSIFPSFGVFSSKSVLYIWWPKYWSLSISPSSEYSGLISFRMDWLDLLAVQGTLGML